MSGVGTQDAEALAGLATRRADRAARALAAARRTVMEGEVILARCGRARAAALAAVDAARADFAALPAPEKPRRFDLHAAEEARRLATVAAAQQAEDAARDALAAARAAHHAAAAALPRAEVRRDAACAALRRLRMREAARRDAQRAEEAALAAWAR